MFGSRFLTMLCGILMIIGGVFCLFRPISTFMETGYIIGVVMLFDAIGDIAMWFNAKKHAEVSGWYLVGAILSLIFAIALICSLRMQVLTVIFVTYMIAAWVIVLGIIRMVLAFRIRSLKNKLPEGFSGNKWILVLILGILTIILGIMFCVQPVFLMGFVGTLMAFSMILLGANLLTIGTYIF